MQESVGLWFRDGERLSICACVCVDVRVHVLSRAEAGVQV